MQTLENFQTEELNVSDCIIGGEDILTITNDNGCGGPGGDVYDSDTGEMYY